MSVVVELHCDGCDAVAKGSRPLNAGAVVPSLLAACPDGWVMFDSYTYCTYCPGCWAQITGDGPDAHTRSRQ